MPTAHRVACLRDDVVFLIYVYQRFLYPVDKTRANEYGIAYQKKDESPHLTYQESDAGTLGLATHCEHVPNTGEHHESFSEIYSEDDRNQIFLGT